MNREFVFKECLSRCFIIQQTSVYDRTRHPDTDCAVPGQGSRTLVSLNTTHQGRTGQGGTRADPLSAQFFCLPTLLYCLHLPFNFPVTLYQATKTRKLKTMLRASGYICLTAA